MDPETNLPRGAVQSLVIATVLYAVVAYIMTAVMDPGSFMTGTPAHAVENPISVFADSVAGTTVVLVASLVAIIAMASMALAGSCLRRLHLRHGKRRCAPSPLG